MALKTAFDKLLIKEKEEEGLNELLKHVLLPKNDHASVWKQIIPRLFELINFKEYKKEICLKCLLLLEKILRMFGCRDIFDIGIDISTLIILFEHPFEDFHDEKYNLKSQLLEILISFINYPIIHLQQKIMNSNYIFYHLQRIINDENEYLFLRSKSCEVFESLARKCNNIERLLLFNPTLIPLSDEDKIYFNINEKNQLLYCNYNHFLVDDLIKLLIKNEEKIFIISFFSQILKKISSENLLKERLFSNNHFYRGLLQSFLDPIDENSFSSIKELIFSLSSDIKELICEEIIKLDPSSFDFVNSNNNRSNHNNNNNNNINNNNNNNDINENMGLKLLLQEISDENKYINLHSIDEKIKRRKNRNNNINNNFDNKFQIINQENIQRDRQ